MTHNTEMLISDSLEDASYFKDPLKVLMRDNETFVHQQSQDVLFTKPQILRAQGDAFGQHSIDILFRAKDGRIMNASVHGVDLMQKIFKSGSDFHIEKSGPTTLQAVSKNLGRVYRWSAGFYWQYQNSMRTLTVRLNDADQIKNLPPSLFGKPAAFRPPTLPALTRA